MENSEKKCQYPEDWRTSWGIAIDPCRYEIVREYKDVTVLLMKCVKCGHTRVDWEDANGVKRTLRNDHTDENKCVFPGGWNVVSIGGRMIDPCKYTISEVHEKAKVSVKRCIVCSYIREAWEVGEEEIEELRWRYR